MGTIYVSGIASDIEEVVRFWASKYGQPHHSIINIFYKLIMPKPWTSFIVPSELDAKFREKLHEMLRANPDLLAAVGDKLPGQGRVPTMVELVSPGMVQDRVGPVLLSELKELEEARKTRLYRAKRALKDFVTAEDEDEPEG